MVKLVLIHWRMVQNIDTKVSEPRMFYRELPFAVQIAKVFPLKCLSYMVLTTHVNHLTWSLTNNTAN